MIRELEAQSMKPDFWNDSQTAQKTMKQLAAIQQELKNITDLTASVVDLLAVLELAEEQDIKRLEKELYKTETTTFLNDTYDASNVIMTIHAGQGGTEAMDWTSMLLRMYLKYCEKRDWSVELVDQASGEEAGLKSVTIEISGAYVFGYLKHEKGAHRLVRQSPFNADNLRQTSFALVEVLPELPDNDTLEIKPDEVEFTAFRSTGHGGQNVNKVSTAVRLVHKQSGITVTCQTQRTQEQNRKIAMTLLKSKLWQANQEKLAAEKSSIKGVYKAASWGNQIRSYVLHPYKLVKDLRTEVETSQASAVLDGDLDLFIESEIRML
jgi:peptide chain release factor 2